jgi:hypothetical protein
MLTGANTKKKEPETGLAEQKKEYFMARKEDNSAIPVLLDLRGRLQTLGAPNPNPENLDALICAALSPRTSDRVLHKFRHFSSGIR